MEILGKPENSPIRTIIEQVAQDTSWDNPMVQAELATSKTGFMAWLKIENFNPG